MLWHNGSNTMWYALPMLLPASDTVLAFATNDGATGTAETAFVELGAGAGRTGAGTLIDRFVAGVTGITSRRTNGSSNGGD